MNSVAMHFPFARWRVFLPTQAKGCLNDVQYHIQHQEEWDQNMASGK